jgi:hypothetical protein
VHSWAVRRSTGTPLPTPGGGRSDEHEYPLGVDGDEALRLEMKRPPRPVRRDPTDPLHAPYDSSVGIGVGEIELGVRGGDLVEPREQVGVERKRPGVDPADNLESVLSHRS